MPWSDGRCAPGGCTPHRWLPWCSHALVWWPTCMARPGGALPVAAPPEVAGVPLGHAVPPAALRHCRCHQRRLVARQETAAEGRLQAHGAHANHAGQARTGAVQDPVAGALRGLGGCLLQAGVWTMRATLLDVGVSRSCHAQPACTAPRWPRYADAPLSCDAGARGPPGRQVHVKMHEVMQCNASLHRLSDAFRHSPAIQQAAWEANLRMLTQSDRALNAVVLTGHC